MKPIDQTIDVHEEFVPVDTKAMDSKNRVTLSDKVKRALENRMKVDAFQIFLGKDGDILLRPTMHIASREAWLYTNPKALVKVKKGLRDAAEGKIKKAGDLDHFLRSL